MASRRQSLALRTKTRHKSQEFQICAKDSIKTHQRTVAYKRTGNETFDDCLQVDVNVASSSKRTANDSGYNASPKKILKYPTLKVNWGLSHNYLRATELLLRMAARQCTPDNLPQYCALIGCDYAQPKYKSLIKWVVFITRNMWSKISNRGWSNISITLRLHSSGSFDIELVLMHTCIVFVYFS